MVRAKEPKISPTGREASQQPIASAMRLYPTNPTASCKSWNTHGGLTTYSAESLPWWPVGCSRNGKITSWMRGLRSSVRQRPARELMGRRDIPCRPCRAPSATASGVDMPGRQRPSHRAHGRPLQQDDQQKGDETYPSHLGSPFGKSLVHQRANELPTELAGSYLLRMCPLAIGTTSRALPP